VGARIFPGGRANRGELEDGSFPVTSGVQRLQMEGLDKSTTFRKMILDIYEIDSIIMHITESVSKPFSIYRMTQYWHIFVRLNFVKD